MIMYQLNNEFYLLIGSSEKQVRYFIYRKFQFYHNFDIPKRSGSKRLITAPTKDLKRVQRNILNKVLYQFKPHKNCYGFVKNKSIFSNANKHKNKEMIFNTDIRDFFNTITSKRVQGLLERLGFPKDVAYLITELCTFNRHLPQGAPTSPHISNLICHTLDKRLTGLAKKMNIEYSRYADDITFSGSKIPRSITKLIEKIVRKEGFKLARDKTRFLSKSNRQVVTGLIVNQKKLSIGRKKYHILKSIIYNCKTKGILSQNKNDHPNFKKHLVGKISALKKIDIWKWYKLKKEIDNLNWESYDPNQFSPKSKESSIRVEILDLIQSINKITQNTFQENITIAKEILKPADTIENFNFRIQSLANYFNKMKLTYFVDKLSDEDINQNDTSKSRKVIELYLIKKEKDPKTIVEILKDIEILSTGIARHGGSSKLDKLIQNIYKKYLIDPLNINYSLFFEKVLINLNEGLKFLFFSLKD